MLPTVECISKSQSIDQGGGYATAIIQGPEDGLRTRIQAQGQPDVLRFAIKGDVWSLQPNGTWEGRAAGANGDYERYQVDNGSAVYRPEGVNGLTVKVAYAAI